MKRDDVFGVCKQIAPKFGFDPLLILAVCEQESVDPKDPTVYRTGAIRLEEGFYLRYVEKQLELSSVTEGLLAISWGLMQVMGESLYELGYFDWFYSTAVPVESKTFLTQPLQNLTVALALDTFCVRPEWQVEYGCRWMVRKRDLAHGNVDMMLRFWNGDIDGTKHYAESVKGRLDKLRAIYS